MARRTTNAQFYEELMKVLREVNATRGSDRQVSFRSAVVNGLADAEGNKLRDSFTSKIKSGIYRPTLDRLINLANFLGVPPSRFLTYQERYGENLIRDNPTMRAFVKMLSEQSDEVANLLLASAVGKVSEILQQASEVA